MRIKQVIEDIRWNISSRAKRADLLRSRGVSIGKNCEIYRDVNFGSEPYLISIGNHVRITSGVKFCTHDGGMWVLREKYSDTRDGDLFGKITIGDNVHIGWNAIIMPGVTIGDNCVIGCGAIVTRSIPSNSVAVGVPARAVRTIEQYYERHRSSIFCTARMNEKEKRAFLLQIERGETNED